MDTKQLVKIDLNLLLALQIMLEERNVSRAAERLYITQPAMSKTLTRLRNVFDDLLFTRSGHGMLPTPRALELEAPLKSALRDVEDIIAPQIFDPLNYTGSITIALSEYVGIGLLPTLMEQLQTEAPRLSIKSISRVENQLDQLTNGYMDFAIHMERTHYGPEFNVECIGEAPPIILARKNHPLSKNNKTTWQNLLEYPLVKLYISDPETLEIYSDAQYFGKDTEMHHSSFETSHLLTALQVLRRTDRLLPGPPFLTHNPLVHDNITALPFPEEKSFTVRYMLVSHQRTDSSPVYPWFREKIKNIVHDFNKNV
jgi:DNA-binding transcriptional LysR family regulator